MPKRFFITLFVGLLVIGMIVPLTVSSAQNNLAGSTTATFRVAIAAPLTSLVDIYINGVKSTALGQLGVKSPDVSGYVSILAGSNTITLMQSNSVPPVQVGPAYTFNSVAKSDYTLVLLANSTWLATPFTDLKPIPGPGTTNIRFINLSPNNNPATLTVNGTAPLEFTSIAYSAASTNATGGYVNSVPLTTTTPLLIGTTTKAFLFLAGHDYTVFLFWDSAKNTPLILPKNDANFLVLTPSPTATATSTNTPIPPTATNTPIPSATPLATATPIPTVGSGSGGKTIFLPMVSN